MLHCKVCVFNVIKIKVPNLESNIKIYGQPSCQYGLNISYWPPLRLVPYQNLSPGHWAVNKSCYYMTNLACIWLAYNCLRGFEYLRYHPFAKNRPWQVSGKWFHPRKA